MAQPNDLLQKLISQQKFEFVPGEEIRIEGFSGLVKIRKKEPIFGPQ